MYTARMRRTPKSAILAACLSLLGLQLSGLHLHVNAEGVDSVPHGMHVHGVAHRHAGIDTDNDASVGEGLVEGHHDHDGDRDVAAVELGTGSAKLPLFLPTDALEFLASPPRGDLIARDPGPPSIARGLRWRPPLRGPPRLSV